MNAQLKGSFLISHISLILMFGLKLRKTSQWAVQKGVTLKGKKFRWRIFYLLGGGGMVFVPSRRLSPRCHCVFVVAPLIWIYSEIN